MEKSEKNSKLKNIIFERAGRQPANDPPHTVVQLTNV
jgi:hypothetical protein